MLLLKTLTGIKRINQSCSEKDSSLDAKEKISIQWKCIYHYDIWSSKCQAWCCAWVWLFLQPLVILTKRKATLHISHDWVIAGKKNGFYEDKCKSKSLVEG